MTTAFAAQTKVRTTLKMPNFDRNTGKNKGLAYDLNSSNDKPGPCLTD